MEDFNWTLLFMSIFLVVFFGFATETFGSRRKTDRKHKEDDHTQV